MNGDHHAIYDIEVSISEDYTSPAGKYKLFDYVLPRFAVVSATNHRDVLIKGTMPKEWSACQLQVEISVEGV